MARDYQPEKAQDFQADPQHACMVALVRKGWVVRRSKIALRGNYLVAVKESRQESVSAKDFRELLTLACKKDAAWLKKQRGGR